jgi:hypothetical protein
MVTNSKILNISHSEKAYPQRLYKECCPQNSNKKGFTALYRRKSLAFMVGTIGFEPTTSTVSR